jgi:hypothetical protein
MWLAQLEIIVPYCKQLPKSDETVIGLISNKIVMANSSLALLSRIRTLAVLILLVSIPQWIAVLESL